MSLTPWYRTADELTAVAKLRGRPAPTTKLGSGSYGQAWNTEDPAWVLKVTRDADEASYCLEVHKGLAPARLVAFTVKILDVVRVDADTWAIWKERVVPWWREAKWVTPEIAYVEDVFPPELIDCGSDNCGWRVTDEGSAWPVAFDVWANSESSSNSSWHRSRNPSARGLPVLALEPAAPLAAEEWRP